MKTVASRRLLRESLAPWRGERIALVPTMGNLHRGHLALVEAARQHADRVVVSIFVNPAQFGPGEDFEAYPRTLDEDLHQLTDTGCDLVFTPAVDQMYPLGVAAGVRVHVPELGTGLCGATRPGHFDGVAGVVTRLFCLVQPQLAVFGEKDYQQLLVIRRLVEDLGLAVEIHAQETVREADGLAMSSRNRYLNAEQRRCAPALYRALCWLRDAIQGAQSIDEALLVAARERITRAGAVLEYLELRRAEDLAPAAPDDEQLVALLAARLGQARLIDNLRFVRSP